MLRYTRKFYGLGTGSGISRAMSSAPIETAMREALTENLEPLHIEIGFLFSIFSYIIQY